MNRLSGLVFTLLFFSFPAFGQQPPAGSMTPREVQDGTAKLVGHYTGEVRFVVALKHPHPKEEEKFLREVQDPGSPRFHLFLSPEEWNAHFAPSPEDEQAVVHWAAANNIMVAQRYPNRLLVDMQASADTVEKALGVTINNYRVNGEVDYSNDRDPQIPTELQDIVQSIEGLNTIQRMHSNAGIGK